MKRYEILVADLCEEIDALKESVAYWRNKYESERNERNKESSKRLEESKKGVANALLLALSVTDNPDGSLSISKETREELANNYKQ